MRSTVNIEFAPEPVFTPNKRSWKQKLELDEMTVGSGKLLDKLLPIATIRTIVSQYNTSTGKKLVVRVVTKTLYDTNEIFRNHMGDTFIYRYPDSHELSSPVKRPGRKIVGTLDPEEYEPGTFIIKKSKPIVEEPALFSDIEDEKPAPLDPNYPEQTAFNRGVEDCVFEIWPPKFLVQEYIDGYVSYLFPERVVAVPESAITDETRELFAMYNKAIVARIGEPKINTKPGWEA